MITDPRHAFGIDWSVICQLAGMSGVDTIHAGMWGGYLSDDLDELSNTLGVLHDHNVVPALSCGVNTAPLKDRKGGAPNSVGENPTSAPTKAGGVPPATLNSKICVDLSLASIRASKSTQLEPLW